MTKKNKIFDDRRYLPFFDIDSEVPDFMTEFDTLEELLAIPWVKEQLTPKLSTNIIKYGVFFDRHYKEYTLKVACKCKISRYSWCSSIGLLEKDIPEMPRFEKEWEEECQKEWEGDWTEEPLLLALEKALELAIVHDNTEIIDLLTKAEDEWYIQYYISVPAEDVTNEILESIKVIKGRKRDC